MGNFSDINILWISKVTLEPGMHNLMHSHDYYHFSITQGGGWKYQNGKTGARTILFCNSPNSIHGGMYFTKETHSFNVMFICNDPELCRDLDRFPFSSVPVEKSQIPLFMEFFSLANSKESSPALFNAAFSYYLRKLIAENHSLLETKEENDSPAAKCAAYIDNHYSEDLHLEDLANYINRNKSYTSALFSATFGTTLIEYLTKVRIYHACQALAYSQIPTETVAASCGFNNIRSFNRSFRNIMGTSPGAYRTSHNIKDLAYDGDPESLKDCVYHNGEFTYVISAGKKIEWQSAFEYFSQKK